MAHDSGMYGAQRCLVDLLAGMDRLKIQPYVAAPYIGQFTDIAEQLEIPVRLRHIRRWVVPYNTNRSRVVLLSDFVRDLRERVWAICHLIEKWNIDVVYTNTVTLAEGAIAARLTRRPHIWHLHEVITGNRELRPILPDIVIRKLVGSLSRTVIVNSHFTAKRYSLSPANPKLRIIHNGVDFKQLAKAAMAPVRESTASFAPNIRYVAIVGAIHPRKGIATFLSAAKLLLQRMPDIVFLVVGDGQPEYVNAMKEFAKRESISSSIRFLGWRTDIPAILSKCSLLVVAADQEPFGLTVIEAMSIGIPVVATRCGGPEEIIDNGATGALVEQGSPEAIASAAAEILGDAALHARIAAAGQRLVSTRFTLTRYVSEIEASILSAVT